MNQELEKVTLWPAANKLSLSVGKTNFMIFENKNKNVQHKVSVNIADQNIKQVDHICISLASFFSFLSCPAFLFAYLSLSRFSHYLSLSDSVEQATFLVARLCSVSRVLKASAGLTI